MRKVGDYYNSHITLANSGAHSFGNGVYILDTNLPAFLVLKALAFNEMPRELGILEQRAGRDGHMDPPRVLITYSSSEQNQKNDS